MQDQTVTIPQGFRRQFTWKEALPILYFSFTYISSYCVTISIIVDKYNDEERPENRYLYLIFLILPHTTSGLRNLQCHWKETKTRESEKPNWLLNFMMLPFSPLLRYARALNYGLKERTYRSYGYQFIEACITAGNIRFFNNVFGDAPILILLLRDDIWGRSSDWVMLMEGSCQSESCGTMNLLWLLGRQSLLISQIAQTFTFYNLYDKRRHHLQHPASFQHHKTVAARQGKAGFFGSLLFFVGNYLYVLSRVLGFSVVCSSVGSYLFLVLLLRGIVNVIWCLTSRAHSFTFNVEEIFRPIGMGTLWLLGITNETGSRQIGRQVFHFGLSFTESAICGFIWYSFKKDSGNLFANIGCWLPIAVSILALLFHSMYYCLFYPSGKSSSRNSFCCFWIGSSTVASKEDIQPLQNLYDQPNS